MTCFRETRLSATLIAALAATACQPFVGIYRAAELQRLPAADCVRGVLQSTAGVELIEETDYFGDPSLTLLGAVAPAGRGRVLRWQLQPSEATVELWLFTESGGQRRLSQLYERPAGVQPQTPRAVGAAMRVLETRIADECGIPALDETVQEICGGAHCLPV